jgi:hypothetical protein
MLSGLFEVIQELQKHCELQISRTKLLVERQETNLNSLQENIITLTYQTSVDLKKKRKAVGPEDNTLGHKRSAIESSSEMKDYS